MTRLAAWIGAVLLALERSLGAIRFNAAVTSSGHGLATSFEPGWCSKACLSESSRVALEFRLSEVSQTFGVLTLAVTKSKLWTK